MTTAVDPNVLLALLSDDEYVEASEAAHRRAYRAGSVVTSPIVYADWLTDVRFESRSNLEECLTDRGIALDESSGWPVCGGHAVSGLQRPAAIRASVPDLRHQTVDSL